ncbi:nitroreductase family protein [Botrimarina hoheduenensis]|uniref:Putative NAD(P)H nitroreductase YodC n=1 Tax=Botrimarina hoheduenensis TaxID=2528000 RepID=A0A5C5VSK5_9BACT|nr:nitroreductase family protein [Botrimarina hoheduenensis]TWT41616.1 putative NAD(P)H nitroreductase YodC [Botrimarina hoheduenensis]
MNTHDAIEARRAVKHYDPNFVMSDTDIDRLMDLTLLSPTSFNIQHWRFVLVRDNELKQQLRAAAWDQAQVTDANLTILVCADLKAWGKEPERYWRNAPQQTQDMLVPMISGFYSQAGPQMERDEAMRSVGIASQTLMLAAKAMGYDSCPMIGFDPVKVAEIIGLPDEHVIGLMITVGKALKPAHSRGGQLTKDEVVFIDRFPS